jgi:hypothetical protein
MDYLIYYTNETSNELVKSQKLGDSLAACPARELSQAFYEVVNNFNANRRSMQNQKYFD